MTLVKQYRFKNLRRTPTRPSQVDTTDKHILWDAQYDNFPLELSRLVENSPSASSCIGTISDFIEGDGFSNKEISKIVINSDGQTLGDFHAVNADSLALRWGFAVLVKYNARAQKVGLFNIPLEYVRLKKPDDKGNIGKILYNPYYGTKEYNQRFTEEYDLFNDDPRVVMSQMSEQGPKYKGQIFYWGKTTAMSRFYPKPLYYSAKKWMDIDFRISEYHDENLSNGLLQPVVFGMHGDPNQKSTDPKYATLDEDKKPTVGELFDEQMNENFAGTERVGNVMVWWYTSTDEKPELIPFPTNANGDVFSKLQADTIKQITIATKVPGILANIHEGVSLGGDGNTIRAAVKLMQQRTSKWRDTLRLSYQKLFKDFVLNQVNETDFKIINHNPFPELEVVDKQIWDTLNTETKLNWIKKNTNIEIIESVVPQQAPLIPQRLPLNKFQDVSYTTYPEGAKKQAQKALKYLENAQAPCIKQVGRTISKMIADGNSLSYMTIKKIYKFLNKTEEFSNRIFSESCESLQFAMWGGKEMLNWSKQIIDSIEK